MELVSQNSRRVMAASICLFAALCMYAPMGLAAWPAGGTCCHGNSCAIPEHHHRQAPSNTGHGAQCAHDMGGLAACSMSCCQNLQHAPIAPMVYVIASPPRISTPLAQRHVAQAAPRNAYGHSSEPLSPPPRVFSLSS